jgi:hypothetical protein
MGGMIFAQGSITLRLLVEQNPAGRIQLLQ